MAASWKPSISGITTSISTTATSVLSSTPSASCGEFALIRLAPSSPRITLVAQELGGLVVDQQDVDLVQLRHAGWER